MTYTLKDVVRCINHWLPKSTEYVWGRITYITFLAQYDTRRWFIFKRATKYIYQGEPITRTRFHIGKLIVIESKDIDDLNYEDLKGEYNIPKPVEERIKTIIDKYSNYKNWQISLKIRRMLGLTLEKWHDYAGIDIDEYFYTEGFKLRHKEI